jgi:hypothetical protein
MNFETHNEKLYINTDGTSLVGKVVIDYPTLKKLFGKPTKSDEYKSDAEWDIEFEDGVVATIYNWKDGKNYCGESGLPKTKITDWHVGGNDRRAVENVVLAIQKHLGTDYEVVKEYK